MQSKMKKPTEFWAGILLALVFVGLLFGANYRFAKAEPGGADFLYRWLPTRLVVFEGYDSPYSAEIDQQLKIAHHGPEHEDFPIMGRFFYPYYAMAIFLPFAVTENFILAQTAWMTLMELAHLGIVFLVLRITNFTPGRNLVLALIIFALFPADFAQALIDGNPSSLSAFFAILALFFIWREKDGWAGAFLAFSTIKPQLVVLFFVFVWVWAFSTRRWKIITSSAGTLAVLFGLSFIARPSWLVEFFYNVTSYPGIAGPNTPRTILSGWMPVSVANGIAWALTIFSFLMIIYVTKASFGKDFRSFLWATGLIFVLMPLTGITTAKSNFVAMLLTVILLLSVGKERGLNEAWMSTLLLVWIPLSWFFLFAGREWVLHGTLIYFLDFYPLPVLLLILSFLAKPFKQKATGQV